MAIAFRASGTVATDSAGTGVTINPGIPAGNAANDLLILVYCTEDNTSPATWPPTGWTSMVTGTAGTSTVASPNFRPHLKIAYKIAAGGDSAPGLTGNATAFPAGQGFQVARIFSFSGCDTTTPIASSPAMSTTTATTASLTPSSISTTDASQWVVSYRSSVDNSTSTTYTTTSGWTECVDNTAGNSSDSPCIAAYYSGSVAVGSYAANTVANTTQLCGSVYGQFIINAAATDTPISNGDTAVGTDAGSVAASFTTTDTGAGADAGPVPPATMSQDDARTGTDAVTTIAFVVNELTAAMDAAGAPSATLSSTDARTGVDAATAASATFSSSDVATGVDAGSVVASFTKADTGSALDAAGAASATFSGTDACTGLDASSVAATTGIGTDVVVGVENATISVVFSSSDALTHVDAGPVPPATMTRADSATALDAGSILAASAGSDTGLADEENSAPAFIDPDAGVGTDIGVEIAFAVADVANFADSSAILATPVAGTDLGAGIDAETSPLVASIANDAAVGAESSLIGATFTDSDTGTGTDDVVTIVVIISSADTAVGVEGIVIDGSQVVDSADTGSFNDVTMPFMLTEADTGYLKSVDRVPYRVR